MAQDGPAALFARCFYGGAPPEDIAGRDAEALRAAALHMFAFVRERAAGCDKLRIFDPDPRADGWSSPHTAIDLATEDRPFIVDSVTTELNRREIPIHLVVHPVFPVERDASGVLRGLGAPGDRSAPGVAESVVRIEVGRRAARAAGTVLEARLKRILADGRRAVEDWRAMHGALENASRELARDARPGEDRDEAVAFLRWIGDRHFTFLAYRRYRLVRDSGDARLELAPEASLGVPRRLEEEADEAAAGWGALPPHWRERLAGPAPLIVSKSARRATVHRSAHMDMLLVKRFAGGETAGLHAFHGLYTSAALNRSPAMTPLLRRKVARAIARAGFAPTGHDGKALQHVLDTFPRDELFGYDDDGLLETGLAILHLRQRPRVRLFVRGDGSGRGVSCLVFVPRDRYGAGIGARVRGILETCFSGVCEAVFTQLDDGPLARLRFVLRADAGRPPDLSAPAREGAEARLAAALRDWGDDLHDALRAAHDEDRAAELAARYGAAFPAGYRDRFAAAAAVRDIAAIEAARAGEGPDLHLYRPPGAPAAAARFKIVLCGEQVALSDVLPTLENMGLRVADEFPFRLAGVADGDVWIHDLGVADRDGAAFDVDAVRERFHEAFRRVRRGEAEDDGFNRLVVRAGLDWREVSMLRACAKYLLQVRVPFSQAYMEETLAANPAAARCLVEFFAARFDPAGASEQAAEKARSDALAALESVASLDQDRILRRFLNVIAATLRTNYYRDGRGAPRTSASFNPLSFKIDSAAVDGLPTPRPRVEIFVYDARMEGVHLRGGPVARGGVRWSDRREDYRTEVLGLMKAQMVKNAVIVPVGAKGGFVVKRPAADGAAARAEGVACYRAFISGLLDVTDNLAGGAVTPPPGVVRHDGDDPYLVVAADKGTAAFSDIANGVAADYGFWLGDAFASGGSSGYDHKKMGITARGAWEAVKRHFRDMGRDPDKPFTVVGVGDMSGDVFGNGMLLSRRIRLIGAFDRRHVFLDPDPDAEAGFAERRRLFALPGSSWADYDRSAISKGGGVFDRAAKSVALTPEIRRALDAGGDSLTPNELISALLGAPADLLWNGGIGTYVKASDERHADVGDRANDAVRIDAADLRCKAVGEGGNLGLTQRARVEAARRGVRLNADSIDNSAGVDCSDREVNVKVLLNAAVDAGALDRAGRDALLAETAEDVAGRCVRDTYAQALGIGVVESLGAGRIDRQQRMMQELERAGRLDRAEEALPDDEALQALRDSGRGLSRPEIAVLYACAKNALYDELLASDAVDDPFFTAELERYFPDVLVERYRPLVRRHRLRREIVAAALANGMVDRASMAFALSARDETGRGIGDVARAWAAARETFDLRAHWSAIEALDDRISAAAQREAIHALRGLMEHSALWFLRNRPRPLDGAATASLFGPGVAELTAGLADVLPDDLLEGLAAKTESLAAKGLPPPLARAVAACGPLRSACGIVDAATQTGAGVVETGASFFLVGRRLGLDWLRERAREIAAVSHWQREAAAAVADDLDRRQTALTVRAIRSAGAAEDWVGENPDAPARAARLLEELRAQPEVDLAMLTLAERRIRDLFR